MDINSFLLQQLERLEVKFEKLRKDAEHDNLSGGAVTIDAISEFVTGSRAAIMRIAGEKSAYMAEFEAARANTDWIGFQALKIIGIVRQLKHDLAYGYLATTRELLHAETFADFLEMSEHLISEGYKDAAAVIGGSALEVHLRNLAAKHALSVELNGKPKKADQLNSELAAESAYSKLDQKNVTAWLHLRNKAAHGHYQDYGENQVRLFLSQITDFMVRIPA
jgi:hypothetical protein